MGSDNATGETVRNWLTFAFGVLALAISVYSLYVSSTNFSVSQERELTQFLEKARDSLSGSENSTRYGSLTKDQQSLEAARRSIEQARLIDSQCPEVFLYEGMYQETQKHWAEATDACQQARDLFTEAERSRAVVCLANIQIAQGSLGEAERILQADADEGPATALVLANLCLVLAKQNKLSEAEDACSKAVEIDPHSFAAQNNFGIVLLYQDKLETALKRFSTALKLKPDQPDILANLGLTFQYQHKDEAAIEKFERALKLDPTNDFVKEKLAGLYRKRGDELRATVLETGTSRQIEYRGTGQALPASAPTGQGGPDS